MNEQAKPCPFCGKEPQINIYPNYGNPPYDEKLYFCANPKCQNYLGKGMTLEQWNTRPIEDALRARIAELEAAGAKLADAAQDLINALPLDFSDWEIVPVHKALLEWNEINKERDE